ncbi:YraN family protein [Actinomadura sp. DC4]|uniref:YraN family protein n=1 Tax=Actinomadura sp. DC4 TaxID=3055069 RepID=UPI0025AF8ABA|nr:YraN family protein [Actinomadura sp. DC4]MDN3356603.1 YraN family protein [Actinomadura sp. DC4]
MRAKDVLGRRGEDAAASHLAGLGWTIIERNWRCPEGELDIVARDGSSIVVCEVKTRSSVEYGAPVEAVTPTKAARLHRLAARWLAARGVGHVPVRVDVIGLVADDSGRFSIDHLKGVS